MARHARTADLPFIGTLDRGSRDLSKQLAEAFRQAIGKGDLRGGEVLPSTRAVAQALGIGRGTVVEAFEQLIAEGFLDSRRGASTRVTRTASEQRPVARLERPKPSGRKRTLPEAAAMLTRVADQFSPLPRVPFAISVPGGGTAPGDTWRRLGNRIRGGRRLPRVTPSLKEFGNSVRRSPTMCVDRDPYAARQIRSSLPRVPNRRCT
jgi:GntR family transcriptional regulator/MocR family aminotransferase